MTKASRPLDDDQLASVLNVRRQAVNQVCRTLAVQGRLRRAGGVGSKIVNWLADSNQAATLSPTAIRRIDKPAVGPLLTEDEVKQAVAEHLTAEGWAVAVAWGHARGIDIEASRGDEHIVLEAKGAVALQPQQVNYFVGAMGELVQRMRDPVSLYGLALPDNPQYRGLVARLPEAARRRVVHVVLFVTRSAQGEYLVEWDGFGPETTSAP
ncbi:MAG: MarR family transcriptional regulator [Acidimicrobiales bacterium]